jgi:hypothetical protein
VGVIDKSSADPGDSPDQAGQSQLPPWQFPIPFGRGAATDTMTGVAAPLLGGFSLALLGVVAQSPESFRLPGASMLTLTATVILMVGCVQLGFRARSYVYSAADVADWWPEPRSAVVDQALRHQQAGHFAQWLVWIDRARLAYNTSIVTLALGVALVLVPPDAYDHVPLSATETATRWAASTLATAGGLAEFGWAVRAARARRGRKGGHHDEVGGHGAGRPAGRA